MILFWNIAGIFISLNYITNSLYNSSFNLKVAFYLLLLSRDTPMTPYIHPPVSTNSATRDRSRDCRNLRQSTAICYILPCPAIFYLPVFTAIFTISATSITSTKFYQVYRILPSSARTMIWSLFCPIYILTEQLN